MSKIVLSKLEDRAMESFVSVIEEMLLDLGAESVGRIADYVGEYGTGGGGGTREDEVIRECLRVIVDALNTGAL